MSDADRLGFFAAMEPAARRDTLERTRLVRTKEEPVSLNYLMRATGDNWKIVDVYLNGTISQVATQRSDFSATLKSGGPPALIESLRQQAERMLHPA